MTSDWLMSCSHQAFSLFNQLVAHLLTENLKTQANLFGVGVFES